MAKSASNQAYLNHKRRELEKEIAEAQGINVQDEQEDVDIFEAQAHHLLKCLEKTTVSQIKNIKFSIQYVFVTTDIICTTTTKLVWYLPY